MSGRDDLVEFGGVVDVLGYVLEDLLGVSFSGVQALCSVHHEEGVVFGGLPTGITEQLNVVDVGHLTGQLTDCELAVAVCISQRVLVH